MLLLLLLLLYIAIIVLEIFNNIFCMGYFTSCIYVLCHSSLIFILSLSFLFLSSLTLVIYFYSLYLFIASITLTTSSSYSPSSLSFSLSLAVQGGNRNGRMKWMQSFSLAPSLLALYSLFHNCSVDKRARAHSLPPPCSFCFYAPSQVSLSAP